MADEFEPRDDAFGYSFDSPSSDDASDSEPAFDDYLEYGEDEAPEESSRGDVAANMQ